MCSVFCLSPINSLFFDNWLLPFSPGEGNGYLLRYFCLENSMDRGSWRAVVHGVVESKMAEQLTHSFSSLMIKGQSLKNLGFSPCSKVSGSGEGSSSPLCYISPGLSLPVPNFPLHSVELLTSLLSSTFLPKFLHFYIIFTPNLSTPPLSGWHFLASSPSTFFFLSTLISRLVGGSLRKGRLFPVNAFFAAIQPFGL